MLQVSQDDRESLKNIIDNNISFNKNDIKDITVDNVGEIKEKLKSTIWSFHIIY